MADKGRDLKVSVLSDADQFDLGKPADDLDDLGDSARKAGQELSQLADEGDQLRSVGEDATGASRDLDDLGDSAKDAARKVGDLGDAGDQLRQLDKDSDKAAKAVDGLGDDTAAAAKKVDGAFDKIATASKRSATDVDKSMDKASEGLDEFKDESASTGREAAASFTGSFDDVASTIQEVAANAFAGFGPLGMAAGIGAAAGIGFLVSSITEAREKVKELAAGLLDLKLDPEMNTADERIKQVLDTLKDDGDLKRFRDAAKSAGIEWSTYVKALAEGGDVADQVLAQLQPLVDEWGGAGAIFTEAGGGANDLMNRLKDQLAATQDATEGAGAYTEGLEKLAPAAAESSEAVQGITDAIGGFSDTAGTYQGLLSNLEQAERDRAQAVADGTKDSKDSWEDYAKAVTVSVDQYLAELERQVTAQENWAGNLQKLARRGVSEGVLEELAKMGPEGAPLVAKLTTASDAELRKLASLYARKGKDAAGGIEDALRDGRAGVAGQAAGMRSDAAAKLSAPIPMYVQLHAPSPGAVSAIRRDVQNNLRPVEIPVMLKNVPTSTWSRFIP